MRISDWSSDVCSSDLNSLRPLFGSIQQPLAQQPHRPAGRHATLAFAAGGAGDVQVRPALALGEARQEAARGDGAGPAAADVVDVGEARIEHAPVLKRKGTRLNSRHSCAPRMPSSPLKKKKKN